jgi:hypothetical protein
MADYVAPEIWEYTRQIVKNTIGTQTKLNGFGWAGGGLFNKVFKVNTSDGNFFLKIECDKIFCSTRKEQTENEVFGTELCQKAGIPCADILAYDFTKNDIGVKYIFTECINNNIDSAPLWGQLDNFDELTKAEVKRQFLTAFEKQSRITNSHFGSLSPTGILGRYETYDGFYHSTVNLLINDCIELGLFTDEELAIVRETAAKPLVYSKKYIPTFSTNDQGWHNAMWGNVGYADADGEDRLYMIDFGNSIFGLPYDVEYVCRNYGINGIYENDVNIPDVIDGDGNLKKAWLIEGFTGMFWKITQQLTEDYAPHWHDQIEAAKKDTSRTHITDFINSCRNYLN